MGEVYRARDPKLKRDVALKVLPEPFARDPERMARFQREAEVLASLNHPNIATIHGVEDRALVMELVEGNSPKGPLPFDEAWKIASQIAAALEYAHERGIMHRDLKPANIMITPDGVVKLLDFGLAKAFSNQREPSASLENSPTLTLGATEVGVILGTAAYMAPEQARGKAVDKRADIWSFGVVLYELFTGERLFTGEDAAETLAAVIHKQPDLAKVPRQARRLLEECLQKDPKQRLRDIGDAKRLVDEEPTAAPAIEGAPPLPPRTKWLWPAVAGAMAVVAAALGFVHLREKPAAPPQPVRFQISAPENAAVTDLAVSPDGRQLAFVARGGNGRVLLRIRSLDSLESRELAGTDGAAGVFWSPDSRFLAFVAQGSLKKIAASGGSPQPLCEAGAWGGGAWSRDGVIVLGTRNSGRFAARGLLRVSDSGGAVSQLTALDTSRRDDSHGDPAFLPDGRHFIYHRRSGTLENSGIYAGTLDAKPGQQSSKLLVAADYGLAYAPSTDPTTPNIGHLLYLREGALMSQPFDERRLELAGDAVPVANSVAVNAAAFSASTTGVLVYLTAGADRAAARLTWFDRRGKVLDMAGEPPIYITGVNLSPDATRVAGASLSQDSRTGEDIWLYEFARGISTKFTSNPARDIQPTWSPDGSRIAFTSDRDGGISNLYQRDSNGAANETVLFQSGDNKFLQDWSPDGRFLLYEVIQNQGAARNDGLWVLPIGADGAPSGPAKLYLQTEFLSNQARFSPDGRWVSYTSDETGRNEIYVRPFPDSSKSKVPISKGGGTQARWRRDVKELFYLSADSKMMAVEVNAVTAGPPGSFKAGIPKALFGRPGLSMNGLIRTHSYDVTPDGQRFLVNTTPETPAQQVSPITVVLNWQALLKK
jgi:Tol biopolymer transport system component